MKQSRSLEIPVSPFPIATKIALAIEMSISAAIWLFSTNAVAFPELTRHGYASCTACHASPNGGGTLTPYGRGLSRELLSTWGTEREAEVGHGFLSKDWADSLENSKLRLGADIRSVQTHRENSTTRAGQFFTMQAQAEAVWDEGPWAVAMSVGKIEDPRGKKEFRLVSSRYYGLLRFAEYGAVRAGRFSTAFGLNLADHTLSVRRPLGFGPEVERDNIELSWLGEKDQAFLTFAESAPSTSDADKERATSFRYERIINERSRVGASFWQGQGSQFDRWVAAAHGIVNISKEWFFSGEIDRTERSTKRVNGTDVVLSQYVYARLNYEPVQGFWPLLQFQHERADVSLNSSEANKYGLGFNFFPRPHFEFLGIWNRVSRGHDWSDEAYFVLHYYL